MRTEAGQAIYENRVEVIQTIVNEDGYIGLMLLVRNALREMCAENGETQEHADDVLVHYAREAVTIVAEVSTDELC